ncbi:hypothetical protein [Alienimonas chondri]|uniref:hypothetical protein n=1 Tax=Alienimonas chondri TaxID=2681879 RepID=UPI0014881228|nr:hypothetical protein [Alienimonas chondri]
MPVLRFLTPLVTLAAVLMHAVLGCCMHHAHAGDPCCGAEPTAAPCHAAHEHGDEAHDHGHSHDGAGHDPPDAAGHQHDDPSQGDPHQHKGCGESECSWLTAPGAACPVLAPVGFWSLSELAPTGGTGGNGLDSWSRTSRETARSGPGDRLRTRVFLL